MKEIPLEAHKHIEHKIERPEKKLAWYVVIKTWNVKSKERKGICTAREKAWPFSEYSESQMFWTNVLQALRDTAQTTIPIKTISWRGKKTIS